MRTESSALCSRSDTVSRKEEHIAPVRSLYPVGDVGVGPSSRLFEVNEHAALPHLCGTADGWSSMCRPGAAGSPFMRLSARAATPSSSACSRSNLSPWSKAAEAFSPAVSDVQSAANKTEFVVVTMWRDVDSVRNSAGDHWHPPFPGLTALLDINGHAAARAGTSTHLHWDASDGPLGRRVAACPQRDALEQQRGNLGR